MSYLAIARKYRPATFDEIVGQSHVTQTLRNAIAQNRIHHAFLFTGARGVGKTTAARALARSLNCKSGPTATPCGTCTSCNEVSSGSSPDLIEIDGASNNSVEDIREIREAVRYAPTGGGWKIYLIDEVHMLSKGAFNALLKTLEEPPSHVLFIFATTEPNRIPDTILSRVQRFDFKRIPVPIIVERLQSIAKSEGVQVTDTGLRMIAQSGEGSMRDAQSLLDQVISFAGNDIKDEHVVECLGLIDRSLLYGMLRAILEGKTEDCLDSIQHAYKNGYDLVRFSEEMLDLLRNATFIRLSEGARKHVDLPEEEINQLLDITKTTEPAHLSRLFSALLDVHDRISRANRPKIVLEMAVAKLADIRPTQPIAGLIERLEGIERRLSGDTPPPSRPGGSSPQQRRGSTTTASSDTYGRGTSSKSQALATKPVTAIVNQSAVVPHLKLVVNQAVDLTPKPETLESKTLEAVAKTDDSTKTPWERIQSEFCGLDQNLDRLLAGKVVFEEGHLNIVCVAGKEAAMAKLGLRHIGFLARIKDLYGENTTLDITGVQPIRALSGQDKLLAKAYQLPSIALLVSELDAEITKIIPHEDGEQS